LKFDNRFLKNNPKFYANPSVGAALFRANGRTNRHDEANIYFRNFVKAH